MLNLLLETWIEIYNNAIIINLENSACIGIPSKLAYEAYKIVLFNREKNYDCMICGNGNLIDHICDGVCYNIDEYEDLYCYAVEGYVDNARWKICRECECYHNICECGKYYKLHSHPGFFKDKKEKYIKKRNNKKYDYLVQGNINYFSLKLWIAI
jgi:hypothetical protein